MAHQPLYRRIYEVLKKEISSGQFRPGELLPTEPQLQERFGVSRSPLRQALALLAQEGYVRAIQGYGTEVLNPELWRSDAQRRYRQQSSMTQLLSTETERVETRSVSIDQIEADQQLAGQLLVSPGASCWRVQRLLYRGGQPLAIGSQYVEARSLPELDSFQAGRQRFSDFFFDHCGLEPNKIRQEIWACQADLAQAQLLQMPDPRILLRVERQILAGEDLLWFESYFIRASRWTWHQEL